MGRSPMTSVLATEEEKNIHGKRPCERRGRSWRKQPQAWGGGAGRGHQKLEGARNGSPLEPERESGLVNTLVSDFCSLEL